MTARTLAFLMLVGACICLYLNTWLAFNAGRILAFLNERVGRLGNRREVCR